METTTCVSGARGWQIKTRLNGSHLGAFVLPKGSHFSELVEMIVAYYGLNKQKIFKLDKLRLEFDGETLVGTSTPEDVDMEDGDLVDVHLDKRLHQSAIEFAEKMNAERTKGREKVGVAKPAATDMVKFRTLLNGKHEHKWMVKREEKFRKNYG